ncbi:MAG: trypsin-like peptidase domain-containing protein [Planctomycetota bacterium]|nr:trypsin-like peptidase domain-containing protein [Planctomycetota bacterium]
MRILFRLLAVFGLMLAGFENACAQTPRQDEGLDDAEMKIILAAEKARVAAIRKVIGSVVAIYSEIRGGGGSGVIFDPSGLVLTNHHVIASAGVSGWGGIADGNLYRWNLVGTDPGGDLAIIKLEGRDDFPCSPLGNSDRVRVGDWAIAMGNPFVLTEDQKPTVTLGIVSGIERYQPGAGGNQLVYGNCIQVDSSINPGNSGGPLFNMQGEIIGINGRGSFKSRGRVNVGLGYAISANQIKNFIPDLMATKLVEHGTLDVRFGQREGKVVCEAMYNEGVDIVDKGLELGDELLEFEGCRIRSNDHFTNLISMLPETWPANVVFKKPDGTVRNVNTRLVGLPYKLRPPRAPRPAPGKGKEKGKKKEPTPQQKRAQQRQQAMARVMTTEPGRIRDEKQNRQNCRIVLDHLARSILGSTGALQAKTLVIEDQLLDEQHKKRGSQKIWIAGDGRFRVNQEQEGDRRAFVFDGSQFWKISGDERPVKLDLLKARLTPEIVQVFSYSNLLLEEPYQLFGKLLIDGGDKSRKKPAFRLKTIDEENDWFYLWATLFNDRGEFDIRLSKASADLDADGTSGGVLFGQWQQVSGVRFPVRRDFFRGLDESVTGSAVAEKIQLIEGIRASQFEISASGEASDEIP